MHTRKIFFVLTSLLAALVFESCATVRKLDAASILSNCRMELSELAIDTVTLNPNILDNTVKAIKKSLVPNPEVISLVQNIAKGIIESELGKADLTVRINVTSADKDTLWIKEISAQIMLDTLINMPLSLKEASIIAPGENIITLSTQFPLDKRLFKIKEIARFRLKGALLVSLKEDSEKVPLDFDIEREIPHEEIVALEDTARNSLLNAIIGDWAQVFTN